MTEDAPKLTGRPTSYTDEVYQAALDYLTTYKTKHEHEFPSVVGLCRVIDRSRSTIYAWADPKGDFYKESFSDILAAINEIQQLELLNKGINNTFNAAITKLVLGKHGYHETRDVDQKTAFTVNIGGKDAGSL